MVQQANNIHTNAAVAVRVEDLHNLSEPRHVHGWHPVAQKHLVEPVQSKESDKDVTNTEILATSHKHTSQNTT